MMHTSRRSGSPKPRGWWRYITLLSTKLQAHFKDNAKLFLAGIGINVTVITLFVFGFLGSFHSYFSDLLADLKLLEENIETSEIEGWTPVIYFPEKRSDILFIPPFIVLIFFIFAGMDYILKLRNKNIEWRDIHILYFFPSFFVLIALLFFSFPGLAHYFSALCANIYNWLICDKHTRLLYGFIQTHLKLIQGVYPIHVVHAGSFFHYDSIYGLWFYKRI